MVPGRNRLFFRGVGAAADFLALAWSLRAVANDFLANTGASLGAALTGLVTLEVLACTIEEVWVKNPEDSESSESGDSSRIGLGTSFAGDLAGDLLSCFLAMMALPLDFGVFPGVLARSFVVLAIFSNLLTVCLLDHDQSCSDKASIFSRCI